MHDLSGVLAAGAVLALAHDIIITLGVFSVFQLEFDLTVLAALLAVVGYSLNDTIVVFDRIRENFRLMTTATPDEVVDQSITQTLNRTMITSGTTIFVLSFIVCCWWCIDSWFRYSIVDWYLCGYLFFNLCSKFTGS